MPFVENRPVRYRVRNRELIKDFHYRIALSRPINWVLPKELASYLRLGLKKYIEYHLLDWCIKVRCVEAHKLLLSKHRAIGACSLELSF